MPSFNRITELLQLAGLDGLNLSHAEDSLEIARENAKGLTWAKWKVRLFKAGKIADALRWEDERLVDIMPSKADWDIAPMLNITAHGDNVPWVDGRPVPGVWLDQNPDSPEYRLAVAANYWCKGEHPRSKKSRKAWYRRNAGEFRAWRLGMPIAPQKDDRRAWFFVGDDCTVEVRKVGNAFLLKAATKVFPGLYLKTRIGFEVDNVITPSGAQGWYPAPGFELRAPVTWSVLPTTKP